MNWHAGLKRLLIVATALWVLGWGVKAQHDYFSGTNRRFTFWIYTKVEPAAVSAGGYYCPSGSKQKFVDKEISGEKYVLQYCGGDAISNLGEVAQKHAGALTNEFKAGLKESANDFRNRVLKFNVGMMFGAVAAFYAILGIGVWIFRGFKSGAPMPRQMAKKRVE